jgi:hypothetical protein
MSSPQIQLFLWGLQPALQASVAGVMYRRRLHKDFPAFFAFTIAQIAIFTIEFPIHQWASYAAYFYTYWFATAVNLAFAFKIIHEVFVDVFRPYQALKDLGSALFKWAALVMLLVSVVLVSTSPGWQDPLAQTVLVVQRCVRVIQCGMVLFLLAFCKHLGISWQRQSFGIAMGFGVFAGVELLTYALYSGSHIRGDATNLINMSAYNFSILVWMYYAFRNRQDFRVPVLIPQRWDDALIDIQSPSDSESLIPMFEHMVDRAFSKAQDHSA